jgi:uncharacterized membrane protein YccC
MADSALIRWLDRRDPQRYALHRAYRTAIVATAALLIGEVVIGNSQLTTFASFGSLAMLLFADFPGDRSGRLAGYVGLGVVGLVLIPLGTLLAQPWWLAAASMVVVGFLVLFAGVLSSAMAAGGRAALLAYILPVTLTGGAADIAPRLAGWLIAFALAVPAAIFLWPPQDHREMRTRAGRACTALADRLSALDDVNKPDGRDELVAAVRALRQQFHSTVERPMSLTTGGRVLVRVPDQVEWLSTATSALTPSVVATWPPLARQLLPESVAVLRACATVLTVAARAAARADRNALTDAIERLQAGRDRVSDALVAAITAGSVNLRALPREIHEISHAALLLGRTVAAAADADARPLVDRLLGRQAAGSVDAPIVAAQRIAAGHLTLRSVWFRNSIRGGLALGLAVFVADIAGVQHAFWVALGAISVLRSSALNTGTSALRALLGTLIGFLVGAALMWITGVNVPALWVLWPIAVFLAGFAPSAIGFAAGQAAFTVAVVVLFNIIAPTGWTVGLVRIEDVAIGCGVGIVVGLLFWPHGATAQITSALGVAYRRAGEACRAAAAHIAGRADDDALEDALGAARAAAARLDDADRQYLSERGSKPVPMHDLTAATNGASRLRLTAEAIAVLAGMYPRAAAEGSGVPAEPVRLLATVVDDHAARDRAWFDAAAGLLERAPAADPRLPEPTAPDAGEQVIETLGADPAALRDINDARRARLLWAACLYLDDISMIQQRIAGPIVVLASPDPTRRAAPALPTPVAD